MSNLIDEIIALREARDFASAEKLAQTCKGQGGSSTVFESRRLQQLGLIQIETHRLTEALRSLTRAASMRAPDAQLLCELGYVHERLGNVDQDFICMQRANKIDPSHFLAARNMVSAYLNQGRTDEALKLEDAIHPLAGNDHAFYTMWLSAAMSVYSITAEDLLRRHQLYSEKFESKEFRHIERLPVSEMPIQRRINIAYFGHHFYQFPLAAFLPNVLSQHDRTRFKIFILSVSGTIDAITHKYVSLVDEYHDLTTMTDDEAAAYIRKLDIDVLIDVSGYTMANRFDILRRRPAKLQMSWLGYLGSTGSSCIDFHITDAHVADINNRAQLFTEKLLLLP